MTSSPCRLSKRLSAERADGSAHGDLGAAAGNGNRVRAVVVLYFWARASHQTPSLAISFQLRLPSLARTQVEAGSRAHCVDRNDVPQVLRHHVRRQEIDL